MRIPADREIRRLHEKHAPTAEALDLVYTHCEIVCAIVEQLGDTGQPPGGGQLGDAGQASGTGRPGGRGEPGADIGLARAGALLHDIGVYRLYDDAGHLDHGGYIRHGVLGHELLREEGYPEPLCRFASCHTGVGISREDVIRQELPLPPGDYLAETGEETLVMYADKFHSKTTPPAFLTAAAYAASVRRFGEDKVAAFEEMRRRFGEPDLAALSHAYGQRVRGLHVTHTVQRPRAQGIRAVHATGLSLDRVRDAAVAQGGRCRFHHLREEPKRGWLPLRPPSRRGWLPLPPPKRAMAGTLGWPGCGVWWLLVLVRMVRGGLAGRADGDGAGGVP